MYFSWASQVFNKPKISTGKKIDMIMDKIRVALFWKDQEAIKENLETAKKLIEDVCAHIFLSPHSHIFFYSLIISFVHRPLRCSSLVRQEASSRTYIHIIVLLSH